MRPSAQFWRGAPLVLASKSAGRASILKNAGIAFHACDSGLDERAIMFEGSPKELALHLAEQKALRLADQAPLILGADQILELDGEILHKSANVDAARRQLRILRSRKHHLHSALAVVCDGAVSFTHVATATIEMRACSDDLLETYIDAMGERLCDTVGGYEIEGCGGQLMKSVEGDMFTIVGLPLLPLLDYLRKIGRLWD